MLGVLRKEERRQNVRCPSRQEQASCSAGHRDHHAVGEKLGGEARARRTKRDANRRLSRASRRAGQEKCSHVRARREEDGGRGNAKESPDPLETLDDLWCDRGIGLPAELICVAGGRQHRRDYPPHESVHDGIAADPDGNAEQERERHAGRAYQAAG